MLVLDGSMLEGGGQILRNSISLAAIMKKHVVIQNIRGGRPKPGLQLQHLTGLKLVQNMTGASCTGLVKDSIEIEFNPEVGQSVGGEYFAEIQSAGACTLMVQISLPVALFGREKSKLVLKGGTNVSWSPSAEYLKYVFIPQAGKFGVKDVVVQMERRGFYPRGGGQMNVEVNPIEAINPVTLMEQGKVVGRRVYISGFCTEKFLQRVSELVGGSSSGPMGFESFVDIVKVDKGNVQMTMVTETDTGCFFGSTVLGGKNSTPEKLVKMLMEMNEREMANGSCVDQYMQDQVIIFMALADGESKVKCGPLTLHTKTAMHFATIIAGASFTVEQISEDEFIIVCKGVGAKNEQLSQ